MAMNAAIPGRPKRPWMLGDASSDSSSSILTDLSSVVGQGSGALAATQSGGAQGLLNFLTGRQQPTVAQRVSAVASSSWTKYLVIGGALYGAWFLYSRYRKKKAAS